MKTPRTKKQTYYEILGDYVESLTGGIAVPTLRKADEETYEFRGLDNPKIRAAYDIREK